MPVPQPPVSPDQRSVQRGRANIEASAERVAISQAREDHHHITNPRQKLSSFSITWCVCVLVVVLSRWGKVNVVIVDWLFELQILDRLSAVFCDHY